MALEFHRFNFQTKLIAVLATGSLLNTSQAFSSNVRRNRKVGLSPLFVAEKTTYEVGIDLNGQDPKDGRFHTLLESVGLAGKLKHAPDLPSVRTITPNDVFCNRELKMSDIKAIGVRRAIVVYC